VQQHHPGRRDYVTFTVPVCQGCHTILTIKDGGRHGERQWKPGTDPVIRVRAGMADIFCLMCELSGFYATAEEITEDIGRFASFFTVRYSSSDTCYSIEPVKPDDRSRQMEEIKSMMRSYLEWIEE
jgi:hypothetical protein